MLLVAALILAFAGYLGVRVAQERQVVAGKIDRIIAHADPDELNLPNERVDQLLKVEDPTFWTNKGIDLSTPGASMTTLSQGLGKHIFFERFRPGWNKPELIVLTRFTLYPKVDKRRTLQAIVANAYFGTRRGQAVIGFSDAASTWFGKRLYELPEDEYLQLVAMLVAPDRLKPGRDDAGRLERVGRIKRLLADQCQPAGLRDTMLEGCKA